MLLKFFRVCCEREPVIVVSCLTAAIGAHAPRRPRAHLVTPRARAHDRASARARHPAPLLAAQA